MIKNTEKRKGLNIERVACFMSGETNDALVTVVKGLLQKRYCLLAS